MKIGIDTLGCDHGKSGLGAYILSFIANLPPDETIQFELFGLEVDRYTYKAGTDIPFTAVNVNDDLYSMRRWHQLHFNHFAKRQGYDVVLFPAVEKVCPINFKVKSVAVVNSIVTKKLKYENFLLKLQVRIGLRNISKIIASSECIKNDLIKFGIKASKIFVVYNGIDNKVFFPDLQESEIVDIKPFAIRRPYFIYGSKLSVPEKKHIELIKAFNLFKQKTGLPHKLVIAGDEGAQSEKVQKTALESPFVEDILITGYFPRESFPKLYVNAEACVFPSVCEGVGLPVLESMASGIPVVCSDKGALAETCGEAAIYFDSDNIEQMAEKIEQVACDEELRQKMINAGLERAKLFSWEKTIKETIDVICKS